MTDVTKYSCINVDRPTYLKFKEHCDAQGYVVRRQMDLLMEKFLEEHA